MSDLTSPGTTELELLAAVEAAQPLAVDDECAAAVELATAMAREVAEHPDHVGAPLAVTAVAPLTAIHHFTCEHPGYVGWHWSVAVSRVDGFAVTVDEAWLEPGVDALVAPQWHPWSERVQPGDLGVGDVFPTAPDDARLTAGFTALDDLDSVVVDQPLHPLQWQLGLGRQRVLSALGRDEAVERWFAGEGGPDDPVARAATDTCASCGWLLPVGGQIGQAFGVCAHSMSPSDGRIVSMLHGCGAHSEVVAEATPADVVDVVLDEVGFDNFDMVSSDESSDDQSADVSDTGADDAVEESANIVEQAAELFDEPAESDEPTASDEPTESDGAEPVIDIVDA